MKKADIIKCEEGKRHGDVCAVYEIGGRRAMNGLVAHNLVRLATPAEFATARAKRDYWSRYDKIQPRDVDAGHAVAVIRLEVKHEGSAWTGEGFKWTEITDKPLRGLDGKVMEQTPRVEILPLNQIERCVNVEMSVGEFLTRHYTWQADARAEARAAAERQKTKDEQNRKALFDVVTRLNRLVDDNPDLPQRHTWCGVTTTTKVEVHYELLGVLVDHLEAALALNIKPEVAV